MAIFLFLSFSHDVVLTLNNSSFKLKERFSFTRNVCVCVSQSLFCCNNGELRSVARCVVRHWAGSWNTHGAILTRNEMVFRVCDIHHSRFSSLLQCACAGCFFFGPLPLIEPQHRATQPSTVSSPLHHNYSSVLVCLGVAEVILTWKKM